ncbi:MBL fold metallo-hydrolase [Euzebya sp.]|uniref:MBL fold metallo-hydrolase n=1 Tax=Euzebya sp. TaxID=1971409 RepID=UPI0035143600
MTAELKVLFEGYVRGGEVDGANHVGATASLITAGDRVIVHDPGMCPGPEALLGPLEVAGFHSGQVTDVIVSHHHPDHTRWMGLFALARVHDHWAVYDGDLWTSREAEGVEVVEGVTLMHTPGHTHEDITTLVTTPDGVVALTHLWWDERSESDPRAVDLDLLHTHRARVLERADRIVPGHGHAFDVTDATPR